jgi:hypothetical protein
MVKQVEIGKKGFLNLLKPVKYRKGAFGTLEDRGGTRKEFLG